MNPDRQRALDYVRAPANGLWRWAEDGAVLVWHDGSTLAFREEIALILGWLEPNGLPPFGAIVFLLAACRGKVPRANEVLNDSTALAQLAKVPMLPAELIASVKAKCVLAEAVFETAKVERQVDAAAVLRGLNESMSDSDLIDAGRPGAIGSWVRQIYLVAEGLKRHSPESLALRLRTGLDSLPAPVDVQLPAAERARRLIEEMSRDREQGAVARAARELLAAVRLPRRLGEREQLAVGGVSDITNRGPLDRLLLSELAHDDLTLAVRVALNEALYLRREPPQREPPGTLALLLDSGLRLWGVPRVLATAVALALVAREKRDATVLAWRAHGRHLAPVDLLTRSGLTAHLAALEVDPHPGEAVAAFGDAIPAGAPHQSVLITHPDALHDPEFRRALADRQFSPGFVAVVDRVGRFELHALPLARRPPLCECDLDLASVFEDRAGAVPVTKKEVHPDLPAIFGVSPFPFLLPLQGGVDCWTAGDDSFAYAVLNDRRLVRFRDGCLGGRELAWDLPPGKTIWMSAMGETLHAVKAGAGQRPPRLLSWPLPAGPLRVADLAAGSDVLAVHRCGEVILTLQLHDARAHSLAEGRSLGRAINPHRWVHGRFLAGHSQFYGVTWDGVAVKVEPITLATPFTPASILSVFDRDGMDGPWLVHRSGLIVSTASGERLQVPLPTGRAPGLRWVQVSRDGHRVLAAGLHANWGCLLDLTTGRAHPLPFEQLSRLNLDPPPSLPSWNLLRVIESISALEDGIALCGRNGRWRRLGLHVDHSLRIREYTPSGPGEPAPVAFETGPRPTKFGCTLQTAAWPSGSKAFLDSRGLLHLKSHDPSLAEVSLVLSDGEVAGWTSDGHVCGPAFFFEQAQPSEPEAVFQRMEAFLRRL